MKFTEKEIDEFLGRKFRELEPTIVEDINRTFEWFKEKEKQGIDLFPTVTNRIY